jgi:hypothetical protein
MFVTDPRTGSGTPTIFTDARIGFCGSTRSFVTCASWIRATAFMLLVSGNRIRVSWKRTVAPA